ncbi:MAG: hypothetical protein R3F15_13470 [Lysobacterales bacterium]
MANARTRFDTICEYMVRSHGASVANLYGKPCATVRGHAFLYFHQNFAAFKLRGRVRLQALALAGAKFWDPLGREGPSMEWVLVPDAHFLRWDRFAVEAVKQVEKESGGRRPEAGPAQGPAPLPPASMRWLDGIKGLLARAASLSLTQREPVAEKPIPSVFMESGTPLEPQEATEFAALADEPVAVEAELAEADDAIGAERASFGAPAAEIPSGRASFVVADEPPKVTGRASFALPDEPPAPTGRASFAAPEEPPKPAEADSAEPLPTPVAPIVAKPPPGAPTGRASFALPDDVPATPVSTGRASFSLPDDAPSPPADSAGRASFALPEEDLPTDPETTQPTSASAVESAPPAPAPPSTDLPAEVDPWAAKAAKFELEAEQTTTAVSGRAVFNVPDVVDPSPADPAPAKATAFGRASFLLPDDQPGPDEPDEPEGIDFERGDRPPD